MKNERKNFKIVIYRVISDSLLTLFTDYVKQGLTEDEAYEYGEARVSELSETSDVDAKFVYRVEEVVPALNVSEGYFMVLVDKGSDKQTFIVKQDDIQAFLKDHAANVVVIQSCPTIYTVNYEQRES